MCSFVLVYWQGEYKGEPSYSLYSPLYSPWYWCALRVFSDRCTGMIIAGEAAVAGAERGGGTEEQRAGHRDGRALLDGGRAAGARPHRRLGRHRLAHQLPGRLPAAQRPRRRCRRGRRSRRPGTGPRHDQIPAFHRCGTFPTPRGKWMGVCSLPAPGCGL